MLIVNADDWGRDRMATDTTLACFQGGALSSMSAMVFLPDSERAAEIAKAAGLKVGLHINFTHLFSPELCPSSVVAAQRRLRRFLTRSKYALLCYNPFLRSDFRAVFEAQCKEFFRLYGAAPVHFDGHQHMHLATNMLVGRMIPAGAVVRRSFSFGPGEKSRFNRAYRGWVDRSLARRHRITDFFFALSSNLAPERIRQLFELGREASVEVMTHAWNQAEYDFLTTQAARQLLASSVVSG